jgi:hypothetical protein
LSWDREATFSDEQREDFYKKLPPVQYHFPHMYVLQQRMRQQQEMRRMQTMQQQQGEAGGDPSRMDADTLKASGMLSLLMSPEGRVKLQGLASKVKASKTKLESDVSSWDSEKKEQYFESFSEHPLLEMLGAAGEPVQKISKLAEMDEGDIDQLMTLMLILNGEDGGKLLKGLREKVSDKPGANETVSHVVATMSSLLGFRQPSASHEQGGLGGHVHGPNCNNGQTVIAQADVSTSKGDAMDR